MLVEFDSLIKQRTALKEWWALGSSDFHAINRSAPRVDIQKPASIAYCAGGLNGWRESPVCFANYVQRALVKNAEKIVEEAYVEAIANLDTLIEKHREAVLKELASAQG